MGRGICMPLAISRLCFDSLPMKFRRTMAYPIAFFSILSHDSCAPIADELVKIVLVVNVQKFGLALRLAGTTKKFI